MTALAKPGFKLSIDHPYDTIGNKRALPTTNAALNFYRDTHTDHGISLFCEV